MIKCLGLIAVVLASFGSSAAAFTDKECIIYGGYAEEVGNWRERGESRVYAINTILGFKDEYGSPFEDVALRKLVNYVYEHPEETPSTLNQFIQVACRAS